MNTTAPSDFATRLYDKLAGAGAGQNLFFSPFSIRVALAMCAVGVKGETRQELIDLIGAPENVDEQNHQFAALLKSVQGEGERPIQLVTANAMWGQQGSFSRRVERLALYHYSTRTRTIGCAIFLTGQDLTASGTKG